MLWRKKGVNMGRRNLKIGSTGTDVLQLQKCLTKFGYQTGPADGHFGYITQEALRLFQRDFRLRVDGIAGQEVFSLLKEAKLPIRRRVHIVKPGETMAQISETYNVGPEAFGQYKTKVEVYPGQNLVFFDREAWGILMPNIAGQESYQQNQAALTGLFIPTTIYEELKIPEYAKEGCNIALVDLGRDQDITLHNLVTNRKRKRTAREYFKKIISRVNGIYLPWEVFSRVDGVRYLKFIRQLRRLAKDKRLMIGLTSQTPRWSILGGLDLEKIGKCVDQVVVRLPLPRQSVSWMDKNRMECLIHTMLRYIPSYKILLRIPVYAIEWSMEEAEGISESLSHSAAMSRVFRHGAKIETDQEGALYYRYYYQEVEKQLRTISIREFNQAFSLVNRYNLAGIVLDRLGLEDRRVWQVLRSHFRTGKF